MWPGRSTTSSFAGSTATLPAQGGWSSIRELVEQLFAGEEAWIVGGAVRDHALERPIVDVDVALAEPERAARLFAGESGGAPFPLSERHGAWRVALADGRTVDFTPLNGSGTLFNFRMLRVSNTPGAATPLIWQPAPNNFIFIDGDIQAQTHRALKNLEAVLKAAGSSLQHTVQTTVFLAHFSDFPAMNEVYEQYFSDSPPARSTLEAGALPHAMLVQIGCIAIVPSVIHSVSVIEAEESISTFNLDFDSDF